MKENKKMAAFRLEPRNIERLKEISEELGWSQGKIIDMFIDALHFEKLNRFFRPKEDWFKHLIDNIMHRAESNGL